jgi:hypothetical protein
MKKYGSFSGTVTMIQDYLVGSDEELKGCNKLMTLFKFFIGGSSFNRNISNSCF